jgi:YhcH/YjgK/YiaL family protein
VIFDQLENAQTYFPLSPRFEAAFSALRTDLCQQPDGKYELDGDRLVAIIQTYVTKNENEAIWETHRRYIDVQYIVSGSERMGRAEARSLSVLTPYDQSRDAEFYAPPSSNITWLDVHAREFAIFFPHDGHSPSRALAAPARVKKVVMKVLI